METIILVFVVIASYIYMMIEKSLSKTLIQIKELYQTAYNKGVYSKSAKMKFRKWHQDWHNKIAWLKIMFAISMGATGYFGMGGKRIFNSIDGFVELMKCVLFWEILLLIILSLTINWVGDICLNLIMGWKWNERGNKSGMDILPMWMRILLLIIVIITLVIL